MGCVYLVWRTRSHGRGFGPDWNYKKIRRGVSKLDCRLELVARPRITASYLLLRALRLRQHHRTRDCDVYPVSHRYTRCGSTALLSRALPRLLFKSRCIIDSLRHHTRTHILWRRLHITKNLVDSRPDHIVDHDQRLEFS